MAIHAPPETAAALGKGLLPKCESRSLFKDRFADPEASDKTTPTRTEWFDSLITRKANGKSRTNWIPSHAVKLHGRLMSRLLVDLAGGVMENANVNLDRYGLPVIPGSAVKGCARRMALQALHDWTTAGTTRPADDDACAPCCEGFSTPADMLASIARVFGWVGTDWDTGRNKGLWKSDFVWAVQGNGEILQAAKLKAGAADAFAGTIAFLPASPGTDPGLELDVVTPHHSDYYNSQDPDAVATDTENPIPVFFPAVKPQTEGHCFTFPLIALRRAHPDGLAAAKRWLAYGLEILGLGAKTAAGYGWFSVPEIAEEKAVWTEKARIREASDRQEKEKVESEQKQRELEAANAHLLAISPDESLYPKFSELKPDALRGLINKFQFEEKYWPQPGTDESREGFQVALLLYLTQQNRELYEAEKTKPKSKVLLALKNLAARYARQLPE